MKFGITKQTIFFRVFQVAKPPVTPTNVTNEVAKAIKRPADNDNNLAIKRIKPTLISSTVSSTPKKNENVEEDGFMDADTSANVDDQPSSTTIENPLTDSFAKLIEVCR